MDRTWSWLIYFKIIILIDGSLAEQKRWWSIWNWIWFHCFNTTKIQCLYWACEIRCTPYIWMLRMIVIMAIGNCITWICSRCWSWLNLLMLKWLRRLRRMLRLDIVQFCFFSIKLMRLLSVRLPSFRISMAPLSVLMTIWTLIIWRLYRIIRRRSIWPMMGIIYTINWITLVKTVIWITWLLPI